MKTPEQMRIENKLKLWETPGFFQFIEDLSKEVSHSNLDIYVDIVKRKYQQRLEELSPKSKFKQGKLKL
jgi:hypothetical protein